MTRPDARIKNNAVRGRQTRHETDALGHRFAVYIFLPYTSLLTMNNLQVERSSTPPLVSETHDARAYVANPFPRSANSHVDQWGVCEGTPRADDASVARIETGVMFHVECFVQLRCLQKFIVALVGLDFRVVTFYSTCEDIHILD